MATPLDPLTQSGVGAFAGFVEVTVQQPLHTLKNFAQDGRRFPRHNPAVLWRGWTAGVLMSVPMTVMQFGGSRSIELGLGGGEGTELRLGQKLAAVSLAGAMSGVIINPFEIAQIQQQKYGGGLAATSAGRTRGHDFSRF